MKIIHFGMGLLIGLVLASHAASAQPARPRGITATQWEDLTRRAAALRQQWQQRQAAGLAPADVAEPSIVGGKILTPSITLSEAPGVPEVQLTVKPGTVGISFLMVGMVSPSGAQEVTTNMGLPFYPVNATRRVLKFLMNSPFSNSGFGIYSEAGSWTLDSILIGSGDGQFISYGGTQLAALFPSLTVAIINPGKPDITPPTAGKGVLLTKTVSLGGSSPYFAARLAVADENSGVERLSISIAPPGGGFFGDAYVSLSAPVLSGNVVAALGFASTAATGTYTIIGYNVCDYAQNCLSVNSPSEVKKAFGTTTFDVTP